jgi:signal transduction histidine kinase
MKIWTKFLGSTAIVVGLVSVLLGSNFLLQKAEQSAVESREKTSAALTTTYELKQSLKDQIIALKDFLLLGRNTTDMGKYQKAMSNFLLNLEQLDELMPDAPELAVVRRRHRFLTRLANGLTTASTTPAQTNQDVRSINSFGTDIDFYVDALNKSAQQQDQLARQSADQWTRTTRMITQIAIVLILLIFVGQFVLILLPVIRSIQKLQLGAVTIGSGKLEYRLNLQTGDEIEQLADEFNQMASQLAEFYRSLEQKVADRTAELIRANQKLESEICDRKHAEIELQQTLQELRKTQAQLIQTEKMSSLGQLVAGVAHEINNPVNFIYGNVSHANDYIQDLFDLVQLYQEQCPQAGQSIQAKTDEIDLEFLREDLPKMLVSMRMGAERIRQIVLSLRNFARLDEAEVKAADIHEGIDSTLLILQNRLKVRPDHPEIQVVKDYGHLPLVECYPGQLNQVFMNLLSNAIDALDSYNAKRSLDEIRTDPSTITIRTAASAESVRIQIADNGPGIPEAVKSQLFDPFFTTKPVGKGTGLGLSISYQVVTERHQGSIWCVSEPGHGAEFWIEIPIRSSTALVQDKSVYY